MNLRALIFALALSAIGGCARGCDPAPPQHRLTEAAPTAAAASKTTKRGAQRAAPTPAAPSPKTSLPDRLQETLGLKLPRRLLDQTFTGLATYPRRQLRTFKLERHLIARLDKTGLRLPNATLKGETLDNDQAVQRALTGMVEGWERRSGIAATRLYLAIDREIGPARSARLRRLALNAHSWRVVALARQGDQLLELLLSPAAPQRPTEVP